jgi:histidinol dehydrogenase
MKFYDNPPRINWFKLAERPYIKTEKLEKKVKKILNRVKIEGEDAVHEFNRRFDKAEYKELKVTLNEIANAENQVSNDLKKAIRTAYQNIWKFHEAQIQENLVVETTKGVTCMRKSVAVESVGLYIPGGTASLFSTLLMLAIPAKIAGCKNIVVCTPADRIGNVHPAILFVAALLKLEFVFKIGGAQAIAAMAYGTETVPQCNKIFGPGNQFVTAAKILVNKSGIAIDMPAGPSEVLVLADKTANASFVAADLISQAEHGTDSQAILVTTSPYFAGEVKDAVKSQLKTIPRVDIAKKSLKKSYSVFFDNMSEAIDFVNFYAAEHLILAIDNPEKIVSEIKNAGSVFLGNYTPEAAGDYASGTNHTLPTGGFAKSYSGVSVDSFVKKITFQHITPEGLKNIGSAIETMADAEGMQAHKNAIAIRLKTL